MKYLLFASALLICISIAGPSYPAGVDRIVIAPAISETAIALKLALRGARDEAREEAQEFYFFYGARSFEPLWIEEQPSQKWMVNHRYRMLRTLFSTAASLGLNPNDYRLPSNPNLSLSEAVDLEMATSAMALRFGRDNYGGRLDPRSVSPNLDMDRPTPDRTQLFQILASPDPASALANLAPDSPEFRSLLNLLNDDTGGPPAIEIGPGAALRPDAVDTRVPLLRARLSLVEATQDSNRYDATLVKAVRKFQRLQGLIVDGIVGDATREA